MTLIHSRTCLNQWDTSELTGLQDDTRSFGSFKPSGHGIGFLNTYQRNLRGTHDSRAETFEAFQLERPQPLLATACPFVWSKARQGSGRLQHPTKRALRAEGLRILDTLAEEQATDLQEETGFRLLQFLRVSYWQCWNRPYERLSMRLVWSSFLASLKPFKGGHVLKRLLIGLIGLVIFYLTGVLWIPPEVGLYLYADSSTRLEHFANKAAREEAAVACKDTPEHEFEACWKENKSRAKARYEKRFL